eukprot:8441-Prymnesium_polylepis.1
MNGHALSKKGTASLGEITALEESQAAAGGCTEMMPTMQQNDSQRRCIKLGPWRVAHCYQSGRHLPSRGVTATYQSEWARCRSHTAS